MGAGTSRTTAYGDLAKAGSTPDMRVNIQDEARFDNEAIAQYAVTTVHAPFEPGADVTTMFDVDLDFLNQGLGPGKAPALKQPYARRKFTKSIRKNLFVKGRIYSDSVGKLLPSYTFIHKHKNDNGVTKDDGFEEAAIENQELNRHLSPGNYIVKGVHFKVGSLGQVRGVKFDVIALPPMAAGYDALDVMPDHQRIMINQDEATIKPILDKILAKGVDWYTPIADGIPQPAKHISMLRRVSEFDGAVAFNVLRPLFESQSYAKMMKASLGAHRGSIRAASYCGRGRSGRQWDANDTLHNSVSESESVYWYQHSVARGQIVEETRLVDSSTASFIIELLGGPSAVKRATAYTSSFLKNEAYKQAMAHTAAYFDQGDFVTDGTALEMMKEVRLAQNADGTVGGLQQLGIVVPFNPNEYFSFNNNSAESWYGMLEGLCNIKAVTSPIAGRISNITSVLFNAMIKFINADLGGRILNMLSTERHHAITDEATCVTYNDTTISDNNPFDLYVSFCPTVDRFDSSSFIVAEALRYMPEVQQYVNLHYNQYRSVYGDDLRMAPNNVKIGYNDIVAGSFTDANSQPAFKPTAECVELWMDAPRHLRLDVRNYSAGVGNGYKTAVIAEQEWPVRHMITSGNHEIDAAVQDDYSAALWPMYQTGAPTTREIRKWFGTDITKFFGTVDSPIKIRDYAARSEQADCVTPQVVVENWSERAGVEGGELTSDNEPIRPLHNALALPHCVGYLITDPGVLQTAKWTCLAWTAMDEVALPTFAGRIAPMPCYFGAQPGRWNSEPFVGDLTQHNPVLLSVRRDETIAGATRLQAFVSPVETMQYSWLRQVPIESGMDSAAGSQNYADALFVTTARTGTIPDFIANDDDLRVKDMILTDVEELADKGIFIAYDGLAPTIGSTALYDIPNMIGVGVQNNIMSRILPRMYTTGGLWSPLDGSAVWYIDGTGQRNSERYDLQFDVFCGLKCFTKIFFTNAFNKRRSEKYSANNMVQDNTLEKSQWL